MKFYGVFVLTIIIYWMCRITRRTAENGIGKPNRKMKKLEAAIGWKVSVQQQNNEELTVIFRR